MDVRIPAAAPARTRQDTGRPVRLLGSRTGDRFKMLCFRFGMKPIRHSEQSPGLPPHLLRGDRPYFLAIEFASAALRFREPSLGELLRRRTVETQQQLSGERRAFIRRQLQGRVLQSLVLHDSLLLGFLDFARDRRFISRCRRDHSGIGLFRRGCYSMSGALPPAAIRYWPPRRGPPARALRLALELAVDEEPSFEVFPHRVDVSQLHEFPSSVTAQPVHSRDPAGVHRLLLVLCVLPTKALHLDNQVEKSSLPCRRRATR